MTRVLLLGGTGFIGSRVLDRLKTVEDVRVQVLAHRSVDHRALEDVDLVVGSLPRFDLEWLEVFRPDVIIHAARLGGSGFLRRTVAAERGRRANRRLARWLARRAPDTRVLYVSGTLMYGDRGEEEVDERAPLDPVGFARAYSRAERPWLEAQSSGALPVTVVRPSWVVGPRSWLHAHYLRPAEVAGDVPLYGRGDNWMSLLDVEDCGRAIVHLALQPSPPATVNLFAPGQRVRQRDFVGTLARQLGLGVRRIATVRGWPFADRALGEALTSSLRVSTAYPGALAGYEWSVPSWVEMLRRHSGV